MEFEERTVFSVHFVFPEGSVDVLYWCACGALSGKRVRCRLSRAFSIDRGMDGVSIA